MVTKADRVIKIDWEKLKIRKNLKIDLTDFPTQRWSKLSFLPLIPHQKGFVGCAGALREL
jgi:hypothetical protein